MSEFRFIISGGGTGGHVFPGLALANALKELAPGALIRWVGTRGRMEEQAVPAAGIPIDYIDVSYLKGRKGVDRLKAFGRLPRAGAQSLRILREHKPHAVIGVGGFASGPLLAAAVALRIPAFLLEQNAHPGRTNRLLAPWVDTVYGTHASMRPLMPHALVKVLGNPVRPGIVENARRRRVGGERHFLVLGGSQGARILNEEVPKLMGALKEDHPAIRVTHVAGNDAVAKVEKSYADFGVESVQVTSFIQDMAAAYAEVDFVIARAGATTIAEVNVVGLPALYVPFALAADDHQTANAREMVEAGAALMASETELRAGKAYRLLTPLIGSATVLDRMSDAARRAGSPQAAAHIAADILEVLR